MRPVVPIFYGVNGTPGTAKISGYVRGALPRIQPALDCPHLAVGKKRVAMPLAACLESVADGVRFILFLRGPLKVVSAIVRSVAIFVVDGLFAVWVGNESDGDKPMDGERLSPPGGSAPSKRNHLRPPAATPLPKDLPRCGARNRLSMQCAAHKAAGRDLVLFKPNNTAHFPFGVCHAPMSIIDIGHWQGAKV